MLELDPSLALLRGLPCRTNRELTELRRGTQGCCGLEIACFIDLLREISWPFTAFAS